FVNRRKIEIQMTIFRKLRNALRIVISDLSEPLFNAIAYSDFIFSRLGLVLNLLNAIAARRRRFSAAAVILP
ncbi:hypothetical protein MLE29_10685, partial [Pasteurella multocida]